MSARIRLALIVPASIAALAAPVSPASAATFSVNPTQIFLSGRTTTALLTLRNDSDEPLRFQLSAFAWEQKPDGEMVLNATQDVVFFPAMLTLAPKEERRVRIGSVLPASAQERTYRIFVEELPPAQAQTAGAAVRVLTKMGIPIFVRPEKQVAAATLGDLSLRGDSVGFTVSNTGTVHFVPEKITVRAMGDRGDTLFTRELPGWYILAGGRRDFALAMPRPECGRVKGLAVDVAFSSTVLKENLQTPGGACGQ